MVLPVQLCLRRCRVLLAKPVGDPVIAAFNDPHHFMREINRAGVELVTLREGRVLRQYRILYHFFATKYPRYMRNYSTFLKSLGVNVLHHTELSKSFVPLASCRDPSELLHDFIRAQGWSDNSGPHRAAIAAVPEALRTQGVATALLERLSSALVPPGMHFDSQRHLPLVANVSALDVPAAAAVPPGAPIWSFSFRTCTNFLHFSAACVNAAHSDFLLRWVATLQACAVAVVQHLLQVDDAAAGSAKTGAQRGYDAAAGSAETGAQRGSTAGIHDALEVVALSFARIKATKVADAVLRFMRSQTLPTVVPGRMAVAVDLPPTRSLLWGGGPIGKAGFFAHPDVTQAKAQAVLSPRPAHRRPHDAQMPIGDARPAHRRPHDAQMPIGDAGLLAYAHCIGADVHYMLSQLPEPESSSSCQSVVKRLIEGVPPFRAALKTTSSALGTASLTTLARALAQTPSPLADCEYLMKLCGETENSPVVALCIAVYVLQSRENREDCLACLHALHGHLSHEGLLARAMRHNCGALLHEVLHLCSVVLCSPYFREGLRLLELIDIDAIVAQCADRLTFPPSDLSRILQTIMGIRISVMFHARGGSIDGSVAEFYAICCAFGFASAPLDAALSESLRLEIVSQRDFVLLDAIISGVLEKLPLQNIKNLWNRSCLIWKESGSESEAYPTVAALFGATSDVAFDWVRLSDAYKSSQYISEIAKVQKASTLPCALNSLSFIDSVSRLIRELPAFLDESRAAITTLRMQPSSGYAEHSDKPNTHLISEAVVMSTREVISLLQALALSILPDRLPEFWSWGLDVDVLAPYCRFLFLCSELQAAHDVFATSMAVCGPAYGLESCPSRRARVWAQLLDAAEMAHGAFYEGFFPPGLRKFYLLFYRTILATLLRSNDRKFVPFMLDLVNWCNSRAVLHLLDIIKEGPNIPELSLEQFRVYLERDNKRKPSSALVELLNVLGDMTANVPKHSVVQVPSGASPSSVSSVFNEDINYAVNECFSLLQPVKLAAERDLPAVAVIALIARLFRDASPGDALAIAIEIIKAVVKEPVAEAIPLAILSDVLKGYRSRLFFLFYPPIWLQFGRSSDPNVPNILMDAMPCTSKTHFIGASFLLVIQSHLLSLGMCYLTPGPILPTIVRDAMIPSADNSATETWLNAALHSFNSDQCTTATEFDYIGDVLALHLLTLYGQALPAVASSGSTVFACLTAYLCRKPIGELSALSLRVMLVVLAAERFKLVPSSYEITFLLESLQNFKVQSSSRHISPLMQFAVCVNPSSTQSDEVIISIPGWSDLGSGGPQLHSTIAAGTVLSFSQCSVARTAARAALCFFMEIRFESQAPFCEQQHRGTAREISNFPGRSTVYVSVLLDIVSSLLLPATQILPKNERATDAAWLQAYMLDAAVYFCKLFRETHEALVIDALLIASIESFARVLAGTADLDEHSPMVPLLHAIGVTTSRDDIKSSWPTFAPAGDLACFPSLARLVVHSPTKCGLISLVCALAANPTNENVDCCATLAYLSEGIAASPFVQTGLDAALHTQPVLRFCLLLAATLSPTARLFLTQRIANAVAVPFVISSEYPVSSRPLYFLLQKSKTVHRISTILIAALKCIAKPSLKSSRVPSVDSQEIPFAFKAFVSSDSFQASATYKAGVDSMQEGDIALILYATCQWLDLHMKLRVRVPSSTELHAILSRIVLLPWCPRSLFSVYTRWNKHSKAMLSKNGAIQ